MEHVKGSTDHRRSKNGEEGKEGTRRTADVHHSPNKEQTPVKQRRTADVSGTRRTADVHHKPNKGAKRKATATGSEHTWKAIATKTARRICFEGV